MNAIEINKVYDWGDYDLGHYHTEVKKCKRNIDSIISNYELSCPIYKKQDLLLAVKPIEESSKQFWFNEVAYELCNQRVIGDCINLFEEQTDKEYDIICNLMKTQLLEKGCNPKYFNY